MYHERRVTDGFFVLEFGGGAGGYHERFLARELYVFSGVALVRRDTRRPFPARVRVRTRGTRGWHLGCHGLSSTRATRGQAREQAPAYAKQVTENRSAVS